MFAGTESRQFIIQQPRQMTPLTVSKFAHHRTVAPPHCRTVAPPSSVLIVYLYATMVSIINTEFVIKTTSLSLNSLEIRPATKMETLRRTLGTSKRVDEYFNAFSSQKKVIFEERQKKCSPSQLLEITR